MNDGDSVITCYTQGIASSSIHTMARRRVAPAVSGLNPCCGITLVQGVAPAQHSGHVTSLMRAFACFLHFCNEV